MKIIRNFLDSTTLHNVIDLYHRTLNSDTSSATTNLSWDPCIVAHSGIVHINYVPELINLIKKELTKHIPSLPDHDLMTMFYTWGKGSYIPFHYDATHLYGATLYLNSEWAPEEGGLFIYLDESDNEYKTIIPEQNMLVVNTNKEAHHVTVVNSFARHSRMTLQMFGK